MSKLAVIKVRENAKKRKNEYFVKGFDVTESVEFLLAEVEKDYEFKKQVELQCGLCVCNDFLDKQAEKYIKQIADLEAKLAEKEEINKLVNEQLEDMERSKLAWENKYFKLEKQLADKDKEIEYFKR